MEPFDIYTGKVTPLTIVRQLTKHIKRGKPAGVSTTLIREPNIYIRTIEIPVYPIYVPLRFSSFLQFNTQYTGKYSSCHLPSFTFHAIRVSSLRLLAAKDKSTSTRLTRSTSLLLSWFSREVFTCIDLEGRPIVVSYTFDIYLLNLLVPVSETVRYRWS